jgi:hypothetical protein
MGISVLTGVASALYDKYIMKGMEPMFVQSWTNLFITIILALCVLVKRLAVSGRAGRASSDRLRPRSREWEGPGRQAGRDRPKAVVGRRQPMFRMI